MARRLSLGLLLVLLLAACLPAPAPRVLKIGLVAPFEGRYRDVGYDAVYAARLAIRQINAEGSAGGYELMVVAFDDGGTAEGAVGAARSLLVDEAVVAVIGHYRQPSSAAAQSLYTEAGMPFLVIGATLPPARTTWQLSPPPDRLAEALVEATGTARRVALWTEEPSAPTAQAVEAALRAQGKALAGDGEAEAVVSLLPPVQTGERMTQGMRAVGTTPLLAAAFGAVAGEAAQGTAIITPYPLPQAVEGTSEWRAAYAAMGPHVPEPGPYALPTYEAVRLLAGAIARATAQGEVDRATVAEAMAGTDVEGFLGPIGWDGAGFWREAPLYRYRWAADGPRPDLP